MKKKLLALAVFASLCLFTLVATVLTTPMSTATPAPPMTTAFGPKQYSRVSGRPQTFTETFQHCGTGQCQIVVVNGSGDKTKRVSSASISLNGQQIVGPRDF